jgi:hypothetical protein
VGTCVGIEFFATYSEHKSTLSNLDKSGFVLTVRLNLGAVTNPYMTARMYLKFLKSEKAILIPKDFKGETILIVDSPDSIGLSKQVKKIKIDLKYEVLALSFEEVLRQTEKAIRDKKAFVLE